MSRNKQSTVSLLALARRMFFHYAWFGLAGVAVSGITSWATAAYLLPVAVLATVWWRRLRRDRSDLPGALLELWLLGLLATHPGVLMPRATVFFLAIAFSSMVGARRAAAMLVGGYALCFMAVSALGEGNVAAMLRPDVLGQAAVMGATGWVGVLLAGVLRAHDRTAREQRLLNASAMQMAVAGHVATVAAAAGNAALELLEGAAGAVLAEEPDGRWRVLHPEAAPPALARLLADDGRACIDVAAGAPGRRVRVVAWNAVTPEAQALSRPLEALAAQTGTALDRLRLQGELTVNLEGQRLQAARFGALVANAYDATRLLDRDGVVLYDSEPVRGILGLDPSATAGTNLFDALHPEDMEPVRSGLARIAGTPGGVHEVRMRYRHADGGWRHLEGRWKNLTHDPAVGAIVLNFRDVSAQVELEEQLRQQALHDSLTGLPNRVLLMDHLDRALRRDERREQCTAVLFLDLDDFKPINDTLGHAAGDAVLRAVAGRLLENIRGTDIACRLGGDEFAVVLTDVDGEAGAIAAAGRMLEKIQAPLVLDGAIVPVAASMGVAVSVRGVDPDDLLKQADTAMYEAKRRSKGAVAVNRRQAGADPRALRLLRAAE